MDDIFARKTLNAIGPDGERILIEWVIGKPFLVKDKWECSVSLSPLYRRLANARGSDPIHALCLALSLSLSLLQSFREKSGRLLEDDGADLPLEAYAFGMAISSK